MPTFATPDPISISVELGVGEIRVTAGERDHTRVEVRPSDPAKKEDVDAAAQARVDFAAGRLVIEGPKGWRQWSAWSGRHSIEVDIEVPTGSHLRGEAGVGALRATGRLGDCSFRTGVGDIQLDEVSWLGAKTGSGNIVVEQSHGRVEATTGSGTVEVGHADGPAVLKNSNGNVTVGAVAGEVRVNAANGDIVVEDALSTVMAKSAKGDIRLRRVGPGAVQAATAFGDVEIGIRDGVAAWLDLHTSFGHVHRELGAADRPAANEDTVEVQARTSFGDVTVRRCAAPVPGSA
jgi:DUF4097 and DUF4098 domain-containing protein YvlB